MRTEQEIRAALASLEKHLLDDALVALEENEGVSSRAVALSWVLGEPRPGMEWHAAEGKQLLDQKG